MSAGAESRTWSHADVVELVRAVVGDLEGIRGGLYAIQVYRGARSIRIRFVREGRDVLGTFVVPLPESIVLASIDREGNPYNEIRAFIEATSDELGGVMLPEPESPGDPPEDNGA